MATKIVVLLSVREERGKPAAFRGAEAPVMEERLLSEGARPPAHHPGSGHGDPVDASRLIRNVSSDVLKALTSEELTASGNMVLAFEAVGGRVVPFLFEGRSSDSEPGIFPEPA